MCASSTPSRSAIWRDRIAYDGHASRLTRRAVAAGVLSDVTPHSRRKGGRKEVRFRARVDVDGLDRPDAGKAPPCDGSPRAFSAPQGGSWRSRPRHIFPVSRNSSGAPRGSGESPPRPTLRGHPATSSILKASDSRPSPSDASRRSSRRRQQTGYHRRGHKPTRAPRNKCRYNLAARVVSRAGNVRYIYCAVRGIY